VCWLLMQLTAVLPTSAQSVAKPVTLGWNAAADPAVRGYAIYYGRTNLATNTRINASTNLSCTISGMVVGVTYRIYAVSYDAQGIESVPSNQLTFTPTTPAAPAPALKLQIARQSNGTMRVSWTTAPGTTARIQSASSPTATTWTTRATVTSTDTGQAAYLDSTAAQSSARFYRVVIP